MDRLRRTKSDMMDPQNALCWVPVSTGPGSSARHQPPSQAHPPTCGCTCLDSSPPRQYYVFRNRNTMKGGPMETPPLARVAYLVTVGLVVPLAAHEPDWSGVP